MSFRLPAGDAGHRLQLAGEGIVDVRSHRLIERTRRFLDGAAGPELALDEGASVGKLILQLGPQCGGLPLCFRAGYHPVADLDLFFSVDAVVDWVVPLAERRVTDADLVLGYLAPVL